MTKPLHDFSHALHLQPLGQFGPRDHDHGQAKHARGLDLCACAVATGVAGDDPIDATRTQHVQFAVERERSARYDDVRGKGQRRVGRIDETQRVGMLWLRRERRDVLAADGEEHARGRFRKRSDCGVDIFDFNPDVAGRSSPGRALDRDQRCAGLRAGFDRVTAHLGRKGMRRIDHMRNAFAPDVFGKPAYAAEATDARRQRLIGRNPRTAAIGIDSINARARDFGGEQARVGNSAQDKGARYG